MLAHVMCFVEKIRSLEEFISTIETPQLNLTAEAALQADGSLQYSVPTGETLSVMLHINPSSVLNVNSLNYALSGNSPPGLVIVDHNNGSVTLTGTIVTPSTSSWGVIQDTPDFELGNDVDPSDYYRGFKYKGIDGVTRTNGGISRLYSNTYTGYSFAQPFKDDFDLIFSTEGTYVGVGFKFGDPGTFVNGRHTRAAGYKGDDDWPSATGTAWNKYHSPLFEKGINNMKVYYRLVRQGLQLELLYGFSLESIDNVLTTQTLNSVNDEVVAGMGDADGVLHHTYLIESLSGTRPDDDTSYEFNLHLTTDTGVQETIVPITIEVL